MKATSNSSSSSDDESPKPKQPIEKTFFGGFLNLRDGKIDLQEYEKCLGDPTHAIKLFCLDRVKSQQGPLREPYSEDEVTAFEEKLGRKLGFLKLYLTKVSREVVFGYHRQTIGLQIPIEDVHLPLREIGNSKGGPSKLIRIADDGCAFSKVLVIDGELTDSVWSQEDGHRTLLAFSFEDWILGEMKRHLMCMMQRAKIAAAGGKEAYAAKIREARLKHRAELKKKREDELEKKTAERKAMTPLQRVNKTLKKIEALMEKERLRAEAGKPSSPETIRKRQTLQQNLEKRRNELEAATQEDKKEGDGKGEKDETGPRGFDRLWAMQRAKEQGRDQDKPLVDDL